MAANDESVSCIRVSKCPRACCKAVVLTVLIDPKYKGLYITARYMAAGQLAVVRLKVLGPPLSRGCYMQGFYHMHAYVSVFFPGLSSSP